MMIQTEIIKMFSALSKTFF